MKLKLAIDARTMGSRPSGIGMYLFNFLTELIKYEDIEISLITDVDTSEHMKYFKDNSISNKVSIHPMGQAIYQSGGVYKYFAHVQKMLNEIKPDVFWEVNNIIPVKLKGDFKTVVTIHDVMPMTHTWCYGSIYKFYFANAMKKTLKQADAIIYDSIESKNIAQKYFKAANKVKDMIGYVIIKQIKEKPAIKDEDYFFYVGNIEMRKGIDVLIDAYEIYRRNGGKKKLVLAGKMVDTEKLDQPICEASSQVGGITYLNYVDEEKKAKLFAECSCFVFPTRAEGFGMPVIEAMQYEKPVIATDLGIFREIIGDGVNYFKLENLSTGEAVTNLCKAMENYDNQPDLEGYKTTLAKYEGEKLAKEVYDFIKSLVK